jgi:Fe-S oxidoreductase
MEATVATLELEPAAVELIGSMIIRQARSNLEYSRLMDFIQGDPDALLVVELVGDSVAEVESKLDRLERMTTTRGLGYAVTRLTDPADQARVWAFRKAGLGLMMNVPGDAKPLPFVEDTAVAPDVLPDFVRRFDEIVRANGTTAGYYGHASVGCLHIRPLIDMKRQDGVDRMVSIADEISDLVLEYGGSISGEHGDGLVRSPWLEKMFGPQICRAFADVKRAFDPKGIMNPGKIVDPPSMTENLRTGPSYSTVEYKSGFAFAQEGSFASAIEMCNGQGACRKLGGTMCPSYMATRGEEHSPRGRANALRAAMSGALPPDMLSSKEMHDVLDLCLACKGCKAECPSNVDVAKLKYEFLNTYHKARGHSLRDLMFGNIATLSKLGSFFAPLSNWTMEASVVSDLLESQVGIAGSRKLPRFAGQTFLQWFKARGGSSPADAKHGDAVLFPDTFTNYNHPELGRAAVKVLENLGFRVVVPGVRCCGRPMLSKGMLEKARRNARHNVDRIYPYVERGAKLVGLEPSCILSFKDDYVDLLDGEPRARAVQASTMLVEEFVLHAAEEHGARIKTDGSPGKLLLHGHCHQKALVGTDAAMQVLRSLGPDTEEIESGCCGMAGSFGFEKEHYDLSMEIGEQVLFPAIREQEGDFTVVSEGVSCRQQIEHGTARKARHLVEVLADAI